MEIHNKIIEVAGTLFVENGIRQVTMDMIAQHMGISKRTIYENFKDKDDLLYTFLTTSVADHKKKIIEILGKSRNVIEALFNFGIFNQSVMEKINNQFFEDLKKYHSEIFQKIMHSGEVRNYELTYTILKRGQNEGIFIKDIDLEITNMFIHYMLDFFQKFDEDKRYDNRKIWISVHLPYLRGICTVKGQELVKVFTKNSENQENI